MGKYICNEYTKKEKKMWNIWRTSISQWEKKINKKCTKIFEGGQWTYNDAQAHW